MKKRSLMIASACIAFSAFTAAASLNAPPQPEPYFSAISPIFGYDPAYGPLVGVAWFSYPSGDVSEVTDRKSLNLVSRIGPHGAVSFGHEQPNFNSVFGLDYALSVNNFFRYETADDSTEILDTEAQLTLSGQLRVRRAISESTEVFAGPRLQSQWISSTRESEAHLYTGARLDQRDDPINSQQGWFVETEIRWQPGSFNNVETDGTWAWLTDSRGFVPVLPDTTLALRALSHLSSGPSLSRSVGGSELLRGYLGDQFSTDQLGAVQAEFRFPVWRFIRGVTFYEEARFNAAETWLTRRSAGLGFRFGLPPDQSMSVRLDMAVNDQGQWQSFVNFNQVF